MSWEALFERASASDAAIEDVRERLRARRQGEDEPNSMRDGTGDSGRSERRREEGASGADAEPGPARIVADADVLAADLLVGGDAREALDHVRAHSWVALLASEPLLDDAEAVIAGLADADLAADWRDRITALREPVDQPAGDHPALATAYRGGGMHVLTFDETLQTAAAGAAIRDHVETSVKSPTAFARLFDPESLYEAVEGGDYPGPDRDPRA